MARLLYEMYQNNINNEKTQGKIYGRIKYTETLSLEDLAEHIADHGSVYTLDVVVGVLRKFTSCLLEQLFESKKVKIDGLGTFYLNAESSGADTAEEFTADNIKKIRLRFLPDRVKDKLTGLSNRTRASLYDVAQLSGNAVKRSGKSGNGGSGDGDEPIMENPD